MSATLWLQNGKLLGDVDGNPILCDQCPCVTDNHLSECNTMLGLPPETVPGGLLITLLVEGNSFEVPLYWDGAAFCLGAEGWGASGLNTELCSGLFLVDVSLCCGLSSPGVWFLGIDFIRDGLLDSTSTATGIDPVTIVKTVPVHYTTTIPGGFGGCNTTDVLIDIQPIP